MRVYKDLARVFILLFIPFQAFAWSPYVVCNNGALVIDYGSVEGSRGSYLTSQYVIHDQGVVEYFKSAMPDFSTNNNLDAPSSIYNAKGELIFVTNGSVKNPYFQGDIGKASTTAQTAELYTIPLTYDDHYLVLGERIGHGVMVEFYKTKTHGELGSVMANWYFENCERVNAAYSTYDPLEFVYLQH